MAGYENILVIKLKHIGDVLVTTPVFSALKRAYPRSRLSVLVNKGTEPMVTLNPAVDEILVLERASGEPAAKRLWKQAAFAWRLRKKGFDLVIELSGGDRGAFLAFVTGAGERIGIEPNRRTFPGRHHAFTRLVRAGGRERPHMVDCNLDLVRALGVEPGLEPGETKLALFWSGQDEARCRRLLAERGLEEGTPYVVLHPTSRWMFKAWNAKGYAALCDHIARKHGFRVVITAAPDPKERERVREILSVVTSRPIDLSGVFTLKELACCIAGSVLFVGVDSAPMHMAAAVNTPALALFGPSGDHMWGPWGKGHRVIKKGWECQPCGRDGCDGSKISRCLEAIEPDEVIRAVDEMMDAGAGPRLRVTGYRFRVPGSSFSALSSGATGNKLVRT